MEDREKDPHVDVVGTHAALLSLTEVGLGSLLHSLHVPFTGHFLSLNQIFLLSRAAERVGRNGSRLVPGSISFVASALKSLSPAGKKLTPMLAISMQGLLFNAGVLLFGNGAPGRLLGAGLSSLWGFIQPLMIYYFIFGEMLLNTLVGLDDYRRSFLNFDLPSIWYLLGALVALKFIASLTIAWIAPRISSRLMAKYTQKMTRAPFKKKPYTPILQGSGRLRKIAWLAAKDMCVWPFVACIMLTSCGLIFAAGGISTLVVWNTLRPLAIGFLLFFAMRLLPMERLAAVLERRHQGLGQAFRVALAKVQQM